MNKKQTRLRRARRARARIFETRMTRLCIHRTPRHIYAQIISGDRGETLASASTVEKDFQGQATGNVEAAQKVGTLIAERAKAAGVENVAFDRAGFKYHGRVQALADAAREAGLKF